VVQPVNRPKVNAGWPLSAAHRLSAQKLIGAAEASVPFGSCFRPTHFRPVPTSSIWHFNSSFEGISPKTWPSLHASQCFYDADPIRGDVTLVVAVLGASAPS